MRNKTSILIVDDIFDNLNLLSEILANNGYAVRPSDNGELAIASAFAVKPDLILLDVRMPELDGFEVCRRLKANPDTADIPVIFISAYDELSDRLKGFELGAVDFITKPFEPKEILARIHTQLEISRLREELKSQNEEYQKQNEELLRTRKDIEANNELLRESELKYRSLIENSSDAIFCVDQNGEYKFTNLVFANTFEKSPDYFIGKSFWDIYPKAEADYRQITNKKVFQTGMAQSIEVSVPLPHATLYFLAKANPIKDETGKVILNLTTATDITERKNTEEANLKLHNQLNQAQKMESVGRLAGGVAHDFNNMLSVILGQTQLSLLKIEPDNPFRRSFEQISSAAKRSADLTAQLLSFARKQVVAPKIIDLNETVSGMLKLLQRLIGEDIDLVWQPGKDLLNVKIDPSQVDQLLTNLLVNARDAILKEGEIVVSTEITTLDEEYCRYNPGFVVGEFVQLTVSDNGCGMTKEVSSHIFEPFFTTKEMGKGTGLGMATVYGIVKQNDGFINVYSEPNNGTIFKIYLPGYKNNQASIIDHSKDGKIIGGTETILIVEDEKAVLEMSEAMLSSLGYIVLAANTPEEAIGLLQDHDGKVDLLLTDVIMPKMNGKDLANTLKSLYPNLKTLFMSGYTANSIDKHGMLGEGVCFLQKPFSVKQISDKVREALNN